MTATVTKQLAKVGLPLCPPVRLALTHQLVACLSQDERGLTHRGEKVLQRTAVRKATQRSQRAQTQCQMTMATFATAPTPLDSPSDHFYSADQLSSLRHRASFDQASFDQPQLSGGFSSPPQQNGGGSGGGSLGEAPSLAAAFLEDPQATDAMGAFSNAQRQQLGASLSAALDAPHLSAAFTEQPLPLPVPQPRLSASFEQPHRGSFDQQQLGGGSLGGSDIGYLGSPPRSSDPAVVVGSPAARSAIGSPVPNTSRLQSPPAKQPLGQHQHLNGDARHDPVGGGALSSEHSKLVILGLPWDTTEETLQVSWHFDWQAICEICESINLLYVLISLCQSI